MSQSILIVDDSRDLSRAYREILESEGYSVFIGESGFEALDLLKRIPQPDLILVDCLMPKMSGLDFLRQLEQSNPTLYKSATIVGFSGLPKEAPIIRDMVPMVRSIVEKPNGMDELLKLVREILP